MTTKKFILAIDQGTTSSRAIIFSDSYEPLIIVQQEFTQHYPQDGWVEHDPKELWKVTRLVCQLALKKADKQGIRVSGIGITNQRETTVIWDRDTGKPIYNAIVWQDRRTADYCNELKNDGFERTIQQRTGLLLDPYFSASKINWILDNVEGARRKAEQGKLAFGTIDSFLIWKLTDGKVHATDATNASRTSLFDIHSQAWDQELLEIFDVPQNLLPEVKNSADEFGEASKKLLGYSIPILGVAGDQHAATIGQACLEPGMIKSTYGTGCFVMLNTGDKVIESNHRLLSTVAYRLDGKPTYALEGSIFMAGAAIQWLRDGIKLIDHAKQTESIAKKLSGNKGVYMVPAFTGLGAPYWDPNARGGIFGLTRDTGPEEIIRATLEAVCYQTADLVEAMSDDGQPVKTLRVDGGMVNNGWVMQYLSDILDVPVQRPQVTETTAAGVAMLAALSLGWHDSIEDIANFWTLEKSFIPAMDNPSRQALLAGWQKAVARVHENR